MPANMVPAHMVPTLAITTDPALQPDTKTYYIMGGNVAPLDTMAYHGRKMLLKFIRAGVQCITCIKGPYKYSSAWG